MIRGRSIACAGAAVVAALTMSACGGSSSSATPKVTSPSTSPTGGTATAANPNGCTTPPALTTKIKQFKQEPPLTITRTTYTATLVTNCGTIVISLDGKDAPHTVNSFNFLAAQNFFNDTPCFRLTTAGIFVLQCGDPTGTGLHGPGYTLPDENLKGATYGVGTIAMANTGQPHSGGSQFFLVYKKPTTILPPTYTPFGHITSGLDVLLRVAKAGIGPTSSTGNTPPVQPLVIESFTVAKA